MPASISTTRSGPTERLGDIVARARGRRRAGRRRRLRRHVSPRRGRRVSRPGARGLTDGIGTKVKIAAALGRYETLGADIVNHCVNDIAVQGARPALLPRLPGAPPRRAGGGDRARGGRRRGLRGGRLRAARRRDGRDAGRLPAGRVRCRRVHRRRAGAGRDRRQGRAAGRRRPARVALRRAPHQRLQPGPAGRCRSRPGTTFDPELGHDGRRGAARSAPLVSAEIQALIGAGARAFAHITGGGIPENIGAHPAGRSRGRDRHRHLGAAADLPAYRQRRVESVPAEMFRVFNMGIGLVAVVPAGATSTGQMAAVPEAIVIGRVVPRGDGDAPSEFVCRDSAGEGGGEHGRHRDADERGEQLAEGKTKIVYADSADPALAHDRPQGRHHCRRWRAPQPVAGQGRAQRAHHRQCLSPASRCRGIPTPLRRRARRRRNGRPPLRR